MPDESDTIALTIDVVSAYVGNHNMRPEEVGSFIASTYKAVSELSGGSLVAESSSDQPEYTPAVSARKSLASKDHIISLIDGKPYRTLKRHLTTNGLTPSEYRGRYGLKPDYPMVAPSYSETRRGLAHKIGLGRKIKEAVTEPVEAAKNIVTAKPKRAASRKPKEEQQQAGSEDAPLQLNAADVQEADQQ